MLVRHIQTDSVIRMRKALAAVVLLFSLTAQAKAPPFTQEQLHEFCEQYTYTVYQNVSAAKERGMPREQVKAQARKELPAGVDSAPAEAMVDAIYDRDSAAFLLSVARLTKECMDYNNRNAAEKI